ncbi:hypothetical protein AAVH_30134, partial [Aphelenchoides avenae]
LGALTEIPNLSPGEFPSPAFPAEGVVHNINHRLMVSLVCRDSCRANAPSLRVWFLVDTSVYGTYLAQKTVDALAPNVGTAPSALLVAIQDPKYVVYCQVSPLDKHFRHANVLGMQALLRMKLSIEINSDALTFRLVKQ